MDKDLTDTLEEIKKQYEWERYRYNAMSGKKTKYDVKDESFEYTVDFL